LRDTGPFDPRGFNRYISPSYGLELFFGIVDLQEKRVVDRFLFNVGQPKIGPSMYPEHIDIPFCGSVERVHCRDIRSGYSDITLNFAGQSFRLRSFPFNDSFILDIVFPEKCDPALIPCLFFGSLEQGGSVSISGDFPGAIINGSHRVQARLVEILRDGDETFSGNEYTVIPLENLLEGLGNLPTLLGTGRDGKGVLDQGRLQGSDSNSNLSHGHESILSAGGCIILSGSLRRTFALYDDISSSDDSLRAASVNEFSGNENSEVPINIPDLPESHEEIDSVIDLLVRDFEIGPSMECAEFGNMVGAIRNVVSWNTLMDPGQSPEPISASYSMNDSADSAIADNLYVAVNRSWVEMISRVHDLRTDPALGPLEFNWDTALSALLASIFDPEFARNCILRVLEMQRDDGMIPQLRINNMVNDRSNPPVLPLCAWKIYLRHGNRAFLARVFEPLCHWMDWFENNRKNRYGLYAWGSTPRTGEDPQFFPSRGKISAAYESGLDDSPMWEELEWDQERSCLAASCVDLSSLMSLSYRVLSGMAAELGDRHASESLARKSEEISTRMDELLYDSRTCVYKNRKQDGSLARFITPANFYPLILGLADSRTAGAVINFGLLNRDLCWGDFPLSSIAKNYWGYNPDGDYWRGRIWPPFNYLVYQGLRIHSHGAAHRIAKTSARLFSREYSVESHVHENYSALTGWGEPEEGTYGRSCPFYTWGGLMALMYIEELLDFDIDGTMRIGSPFFTDPARIDAIPVRGRLWSVSASANELRVLVDNELFIHSSPGVGIRGFTLDDGRLVFTLYGRGETEISLSPSALVAGSSIARLYDSDLFLGKFDLREDSMIRMTLTLEPNVPKVIKIKLLG
jgi:hypothetical protein